MTAPVGRCDGRGCACSAPVLPCSPPSRWVTSSSPRSPSTSAWQAPFVRPAIVGEPVDLRYARLTAGEPAGLDRPRPDDGSLLATPGVWLTVPLTIEAAGQPRALGLRGAARR